MNFVLDEQAAAIAGLQVGNTTQFGVEGAQIPGRLTGIVSLMPTADNEGLEGVMVTRLDALLHWLNPEPRSYWNTGDSIVGEYGIHTDGVYECRNLRQLESFVEKLT